ncbi:hypothetical protein SRHO_G00043800 [Serrasalmus rhombeus]
MGRRLLRGRSGLVQRAPAVLCSAANLHGEAQSALDLFTTLDSVNELTPLSLPSHLRLRDNIKERRRSALCGFLSRGVGDWERVCACRFDVRGPLVWPECDSIKRMAAITLHSTQWPDRQRERLLSLNNQSGALECVSYKNQVIVTDG